jgi:hypothetical protein
MADDPLSLPGEIWKPVHANPDQYQVSSLGRVCNTRRGRLLSQEDRHENGYRRVGIHKDGAQKTWPVHVLVCIAFYGPRQKDASRSIATVTVKTTGPIIYAGGRPGKTLRTVFVTATPLAGRSIGGRSSMRGRS